MTVEDWAAMAAWVAALVAVASTVVTLLLQWWHRTQPEWVAVTAAISRSVQAKMMEMGRTPATIGVELMNVGDGAAFDVQVTVDDTPCEVIELKESTSSIRLDPVAGVVMPGSRFGVVLPALAANEEHRVVIVWTASPTRWKRRWEQTLPLSRQGFGARLPAVRTRAISKK